MSRAMTALLLSCLLIGPSAAQDAAEPLASNLLTRYLDEANIHPAVHVGRMTIFPVVVDAPSRLTGVLTLDEALRKKLLVIEELDSATVGKARFVNKSGDQMIFLMAGEVITGGKQNRTLTTDALLAPESSAVLELYCVQKGRWQGKQRFAPGNSIAPQGVRARASQKAGQDAVWSEVAASNSRLGAANATSDLNEAMTKPANVKRLRELRRPVVAKLPAGTCGIVVSDGRRIVGADLFNSSELFDAMQTKVLDAYLSQYAIGGEETKGRRRPVQRPGAYDVRDYLQACYKAEFTSGPKRGAGRIHHLRGARYGETIAYTKALPVRRPPEDYKRRIRPHPPTVYMVHTALMQRVVPVRPGPTPPPVVRPPVPMPRPEPR